MSITAVSFAFVRFDAAGLAAASAPLRESSPPPPSPRPAHEQEHEHEHHAGRKAPLMRALTGALADLVAQGSPAGTTATATGTTDPNAADLDEALMNFARALAQALRGNDQGEDRREGDGERRHGHQHGHHGHHHRHDRLAVGDPAQRVEALGTRLSPARSPAPADVAAPAAVSTPDTTAATASPTDDGVAAQAVTATPASTPAGSNVVFIAVFRAPNADAPVSSLDRLLDAFAGVQQALGQPAADSRDTLKAQLSAFLQALAQRLGGEAIPGDEATAPGALLDVSA